MKALVMSIFFFMNVLSSAMAQVLTPAIKDPNLVWIWAGPAIALFVISIISPWQHWYMNSDEFMTAEELDMSSSSEEDVEKTALPI